MMNLHEGKLCTSRTALELQTVQASLRHLTRTELPHQRKPPHQSLQALGQT